MKIQIIGVGTVGTSTGEGFFRFGHKVVFCDVNKEKLQQFKRAHFICTPEGVVEKVIDELAKFDGLIVIRSSVLHGTTTRLTEKHGEAY